MSEDLALQNLSKLLRERKTAETEEIERIEKERLGELRERLSELWSSELSTIEEDIREKIEELGREQREKIEELAEEISQARRSLVRSSVAAVLHPMSLILIPILIAISAWGLSLWLTPEVVATIERSDIVQDREGVEFVPVSKIVPAIGRIQIREGK